MTLLAYAALPQTPRWCRFFPTPRARRAGASDAQLMRKAICASQSAFALSHTMLVPVRISASLAPPSFGDFELSSFSGWFSTSAPFRRRAEGRCSCPLAGRVIIEFTGGMTERRRHLHPKRMRIPDKLHTVGKPAATSDIRLIDDDGHELPPKRGRYAW